jgi:hypothetical protein
MLAVGEPRDDNVVLPFSLLNQERLCRHGASSLLLVRLYIWVGRARCVPCVRRHRIRIVAHEASRSTIGQGSFGRCGPYDDPAFVQREGPVIAQQCEVDASAARRMVDPRRHKRDY